MVKLPVLQDRDVVRLLVQLGFSERRQSGSHKVFKHPDGRRIVVAMHASKDIPRGTLGAIIKDVGISTEKLETLLKS